MIFDPTSLTFSGVPTNFDAGLLGVRVFATDETGSFVSNRFQITVLARIFLPIIGRSSYSLDLVGVVPSRSRAGLYWGCPQTGDSPISFFMVRLSDFT